VDERMNFPETITEHSKPVWTNSEWFTNGSLDYVKSYFHHVKGVIGMHSCEFYELNIVVDGSGRHYLDHYSFKVTPGCVFMIPPYIRHGYWTETTMNVFHALIKCSFFERYEQE
jgi:mannose-6-phosphate isomerase-like protein (cupin superfamily)